jgi:hypothetical protein
MGRLTLRLPESLHQQLESQARQEKVSLNQYLVYALTRHVAMAYMVTPIPEEAVQQQREAFTALLENLGQASSAEIRQPCLNVRRSPLNKDWTLRWRLVYVSGSLMLRREMGSAKR